MKRLFDIVCSFIGLLLLLPVLFVLWAMVRGKLGKPAFFRQRRIGYRGKVFEIVKFRTMTDARGPDGRPLSDLERMTDFGKFLRSTSLDELPELWNVLKGDMSFVGPRPLVEENRELYTPEQFRRHDVMPGITGWAQINGRNGISWEDRFVLDLWYVEHHTFKMDLGILFKTVLDVFRKEGAINAEEGTGIPYSDDGTVTVDAKSIEREFRTVIHALWHLAMRCATDMLFLVLSLYVAYQIRFWSTERCAPEFWPQAPYFWRQAGMLVVFVFGMLLVTGSYRHLWRRFGLSDILRYIAVFGAASVLVFSWRLFIANVYPRAINIPTLGMALVFGFWFLLSARLLRRALFVMLRKKAA